MSVTDVEIKIHGFKKCTIMSGGIGLKVNLIICDVSCPIIGNLTMEDNQCYATTSQVMDYEPAFSSWNQDGQDW
eukprot:3356714-Amphidinium_carterae.1